MRSIFAIELPGTTVIGIGSSAALKGFYTRTIHLRPLEAQPARLRPHHRPAHRYPAEVERQAV